MRLFKRNDTNVSAIPEDLQPYYSTQKFGWRRWVLPVLRVVLLFAVLVLLVWGGVVLVHHFTANDSGKNPAQTSTQNLPDSTAKKQSSGSTSTSPAAGSVKQPTTSAPTSTAPSSVATNPSSPTATSSPSTPTTSTSSPTTSPATTNEAQPLTNTGPGETAALFVIFAFAGAFVHRMFTLRKLRN